MKKAAALVLAVCMGVSLTACGSGTQPSGAGGGSAESSVRYSLGSGSSGGNFYLVGGGIATILNNAFPDRMVVTSEETGGSTANLTMIQNGEAELGIAMTSSLAEAWEGTAEWTGGKMDKIRGLIPLYPSYMTMYALKSSNIHSITDFNGKIIGLGSKGAAMDSVLREAFGNMGIQPASIFNDGHGATASAVADGQVDAAILFSYPPFSAITELEATQDLDFIGLTEEEQKKLVEDYPFYSVDTLKAGSYRGAAEDIPVVSEWNMLVTSSEVPEELAYEMTKALLESNEELVAVHKSLTYAAAENEIHYNVPLHAGTVRYLKEIGAEIPEALIPEEYTGS